MGNCSHRACPHRETNNEPPAAKVETPAPDDLPIISLEQVRRSGWLIISGKIYNPQPYLGKHPGGQDILIGFAGMDVTVEFETMQHSSLASSLLQNLVVGKIDTSQDGNLKDWGLREPPAYPLLHDQPAKKVSRKLTGGLKPGTSPSSADMLLESSLNDWWNVDDRGFLPGHDPVKELPRPWKAFTDVLEILPAMIAEYTFQDYLERHVRPELPQTEQEVDEALRALSEAVLESLHSTLGYICLSYVRSPPDIYDDGLVLESVSTDPEKESAKKLLGRPPDEQVLPSWLARPWIMTSNMLKRRPMLDYAGCVLNNWERINPEGPISPSNVRLLRRFTGLADEEWFFKTHIIIESEGSHVVSALGSISEALAQDDTRSVLQELHALEEAMWRVSSVCLPIMYARSPSNQALLCEPFMFFFRLRPYIKSLDLSFRIDESVTEQWKLHGPSGAMSSILPCVDAVLGIKNSSTALRETVKAFESYVPEAHRAFMSSLQNVDCSVKSYIQSKRVALEDTTWYALAGAYNAVLARVLDFRWRHLNFVHNFIVRPASGLGGVAGSGGVSGSACPMAQGSTEVDDLPRSESTPAKTHSMEGTGGTSFDYLQQHISDSQEARFDLSPAWDHHKSRADSYTASVDTPRSSTSRLRADPCQEETSFKESNFWEPRHDGNGFLANRQATMPQWSTEAEAPLPGLAALQRLVWSIPGDCVECKCIFSSRDTHPFISKCHAARPRLEALVEKDTDGCIRLAKLPVSEIEQAWLLLSSVASAYRVATTQVNAGPAIHPDFLLDGDVCPAIRQGRARKDSAPCAAGKALQEFAQALPVWLRNVVTSVSKIVKRPAKPAPEYCEVTLNNWRLAREYESENEGFQVSLETVHKIRPIVRFIGLPDEDWYRKLHTVLEAEGGRAIATAQKSMSMAIKHRDNAAVATALNALGQHIERMNEFQRHEFDHKDSRGEAIMMQRLLPFLAPHLTHEECAVWIYTEGSSPLLPSLHAFLGLTNMERIPGALQEHWQVERVADLTSMPAAHLEFLDTLTKGGTSVRAYCLKEWRHSTVEALAALEDSFNNCLEALLRYCNLRQRLVNRMFPDIRLHSLSDAQEKVIRRGRLALLQMRRVADAHRLAQKPVIPSASEGAATSTPPQKHDNANEKHSIS